MLEQVNAWKSCKNHISHAWSPVVEQVNAWKSCKNHISYAWSSVAGDSEGMEKLQKTNLLCVS